MLEQVFDVFYTAMDGRKAVERQPALGLHTMG